jgi:serine/threonine-protein kinase
MELVVGDTLKTLVQRTGPLPVSLVLDIAAHVCEALDAAHKLGLVHRDIKPENIVLIAQREGPPQAKILDFGISRLREETSGAKGLTQTGMVIGTPEYMSPEQARGKRGNEIDGRSDLYSLGIVMYRMLTGELPFQADTTVEMILQQLNTQPKAPHQLKPELAIPENVSAIVMKALQKDREKRYATGAEMAAAIKKARGSTTLTTHKIDFGSLSAVEATFGSERGAAGSPAARSSATPARAATSGAATPTAPAAEKPIYRSSARIEPPTKEFPTRLVLTLVAVAVLLVGAFAAWKYLGSGNSANKAAGTMSGTAASKPAKGAEPGHEEDQKTAEPAQNGPAVNGQKPAQRKTLSFEEQEKIIELTSLAAIDYREGGCQKALPTYQKILDIDPGNPRAYAAVQKCYAKARNGVPIAPAPTTPAAPPNP